MIGAPPLSAPENSRNVCPNELAPSPTKRPWPSNTGRPGPGHLLLGDGRALGQRLDERDVALEDVGHEILVLVAQPDAPDLVGEAELAGACPARRTR